MDYNSGKVTAIITGAVESALPQPSLSQNIIMPTITRTTTGTSTIRTVGVNTVFFVTDIITSADGNTGAGFGNVRIDTIPVFSSYIGSTAGYGTTNHISLTTPLKLTSGQVIDYKNDVISGTIRCTLIGYEVAV